MKRSPVRRRSVSLLFLLVVMLGCAVPDSEPAGAGREQIDSVRSALTDPSSDAFAAFDAWLAARQPALQSARGASDVAQGAALAVARAQSLKALLEQDPAAALARALPSEVHESVPSEVARLLEQPLDARGDFLVRVSIPRDRASAHRAVSHVERSIVVHGKSYPAHVFGRRAKMRSKLDIPLHGFILDGQAVLSELPARIVSRAAAGLIANVGGQAQTFASTRVFDDFVRQQSQVEEAPGPSANAFSRAAANPWTQGPKRILHIRVDFSDLPGDPISLEQAQTDLEETNRYFVENSGGATWFSEMTVTPLLRMPQPSSAYAYGSGDVGALQEHARSAALAVGYDTSTYDLDIVSFAYLGHPWGGMATVGFKGAWFQGASGLYITAHELGHNYGLWHSSLWQTSDNTPFGKGEKMEYGNLLDVMGTGYFRADHFSMHHKLDLGWIDPSDVPPFTSNGVYRIQAHDTVGATGVRGLQTPRDLGRSLFLEYRARIEESPGLATGVIVNLADGSDQNLMIDPSPLSQYGSLDLSVALGQTLVDPQLKLFITPIAQVMVGEQPALDVMVNRGPFPENAAPVVEVLASATNVRPGEAVFLTASASDVDGDPIVYHWTFDDGSLPGSGASVMKHYDRPGLFITRVEASDMKGGRVSRNIPIRVEADAMGLIRGRVYAASGEPLEGVLISHGYGRTLTDSTGAYALPGYGGESYAVSASLAETVFSPSQHTVFVSAGGEVTDVDFHGSPTVIRIDVGSEEAYVDAHGATFRPDYSGDGITVDRGDIPIEDTDDDRLYQTERFGLSGYSVPVANGSYSVTLHFAETYDGITGAGQRVFGVNVDGADLGEIDVYARTGGRNRALVVRTNVMVWDGAIDLSFTPIVQNTLINAIEVGPADPRQDVRIDCGSDAPYIDGYGAVWESDRNYVDGIAVDRGNIAIEATTDGRLFQTERFSVSAYEFSVPNGIYIVSLGFAETYNRIVRRGQRVFDVDINGMKSEDLDIFALAGGRNRPYEFTSWVAVKDGVLRIQFAPNVQNTLINSIHFTSYY